MRVCVYVHAYVQSLCGHICVWVVHIMYVRMYIMLHIRMYINDALILVYLCT